MHFFALACAKNVSRFHIGGFSVREAGVITDGEGALCSEGSLYAVDDEQGVVRFGEMSCGVVKRALQALSGLALAHNGFHVPAEMLQ